MSTSTFTPTSLFLRRLSLCAALVLLLQIVNCVILRELLRARKNHPCNPQNLALDESLQNLRPKSSPSGQQPARHRGVPSRNRNSRVNMVGLLAKTRIFRALYVHMQYRRHQQLTVASSAVLVLFGALETTLTHDNVVVLATEARKCGWPRSSHRSYGSHRRKPTRLLPTRDGQHHRCTTQSWNSCDKRPQHSSTDCKGHAQLLER